MNKPKAIILLSGGLDSFISLVAAQNDYDIKLALTFDYGQRAVKDEIEASKKICKIYNIKHKIIKLPFLKDISNSALNNTNKNLEFDNLGIDSMKAVWVPNRNGLFLNIAGCFCDAMKLEYIIFGANKEEAGTFSDNSSEFCTMADRFLEYSTLNKPKVLAPLINLEKFEIINLAIKLDADLSLLKSCYNSTNEGKHCGICESCKRLKNAILKSSNKDLIKLFF